MPLRVLFTVAGGKGTRVQAAWNAAGTLLAVCGANGLARVFDRAGAQVAEAQLDARAHCTRLDWDKDGEVRAGSARLRARAARSPAHFPRPIFPRRRPA